MLTRNFRRPLSAAVAACALLGALMACSSTAPSAGSSAGTSAPAASSMTPSAESSPDCAQLEALKASLVALGNVNVVKNGVDALNSAVAAVKINLDSAASTASSNVAPELNQVRIAFDAVQTATSGLTKNNLREKAPAIASSLGQLATATKALSEAVSQRCTAS